MSIPDEILDYYKSNRFNIDLGFIDKPSQHFIAVKTSTGTVRRIPIKIHTKEQLVKWLIKLQGVDLYYSSSKFLKPLKVRYKNGNPIDIINVGHLFVIDIDPMELSLAGIENAKAQARQVYDSLAAVSSIKLKYMVFSGRGFQIAYEDTVQILPVDYKRRVTTVEQYRKAFIGNYLVGYRIDKGVSSNINAIVRFIGSANSKTGFICTKIARKDLDKPIRAFLTDIPYATKERPVIPDQIGGIGKMKAGKMMKPPRAISAPGLCDQVKAPQESMPATFMSNRILGTKDRRVLFLTYDLALKDVKRDIRKLIRVYKLEAVYIFQLRTKYYGLSLKPLQNSRISKILIGSKAIHKKEPKKYGESYMPLKIGEEKLVFCDIIYGEIKSMASRGHLDLLKEQGIPVLNDYKPIGKEGIVIYNGVLN